MSGLRRRDALVLAAAAPFAAAATARAAGDPTVTALAEALRREQATAVVYEAVAARGLLPSIAEPFAAHEREQAEALADALEAIGGTPLPEPPELGAGNETEGALAELAIEAELEALAAHDAVLRATDEAALIATVASIMAAAGTHLAVLRERLGREPVPNALERAATL